MGCSKSSSKRKVYSNTILPQEPRKICNIQSNLTPKGTRERKTKSKVTRRKEIIKIRAEINEIETKKTTGKINKTKSWFFEKINKIDKPLARLIKKKRERTQINKIRNEEGEVTMDTAEIQSIIRDCCKQLYANKMDNLEEMDKYIDNPKDATRKLLGLIIEFGKISGYKINAQKSLAFLYTNNERSEREIKETIPFTIVTKRIKYLGINLPKEVKDLYSENY